jgi:putative photosynthetic complex assembly protein
MMSDVAVKSVLVPKGAIRAAFALVVFTVLAASVGRFTGVGTVRSDHAAMVQSVALRFEDRADGGVAVIAPEDNRLLDVVAAGHDGFLRTVLRSLAFDRRRHAIGAGPSFAIDRWSDGHLTLNDPATGRSVDLAPFGRDNMQTFERLMAMGGQR